MKALFELFRRFDARRIFGFIRRLGGMSRPKVKCYDLRSTRALRVEGDYIMPHCLQFSSYFYPRPPGGGRHHGGALAHAKCIYISIHALRVEGDLWLMGIKEVQHDISIHALRVEGDLRSVTVGRCVRLNFYPRPPGGGRRPRPVRGARPS